MQPRNHYLLFPPVETFLERYKYYGCGFEIMGCGGCHTNPELAEVEPKDFELPKGGIVVTLTQNAASKVKEYMASENKKGHALRVLVVPGGCAGYQYGLDFDDKQSKDDVVVEQYGVKLVVDKKSAGHLVGTTIDFVDSLHGSGFKISNPNAQSTCGCGNSFG